MYIRIPFIVELAEVYKLMGYIPAVELPTYEIFVERVLAEKYPEMFVAIEHGKPVGVAIFSTRYDMWGEAESFLYILAVHPKYRRKKIGTALLNKVLLSVKKLNASYLEFLVHKDNAGAFAFYETFGFSEAELDDFKMVAIPVEVNEGENNGE